LRNGGRLAARHLSSGFRVHGNAGDLLKEKSVLGLPVVLLLLLSLMRGQPHINTEVRRAVKLNDCLLASILILEVDVDNLSLVVLNRS
jgi:hypothetical protein